MQTAQQLRMGGRIELAARPGPLIVRQMPAPAARVGRMQVVAAGKRAEEAGKHVVLPAAVTALSASTAGAAVAATVVPTGSGVQVAGGGGGTANSPISVEGAVNQLVEAIRAAGGVVQQGVDAAGVGAQYVKGALDEASPYVKSATDTVSPYVKTAVDTVRDVAGPAFRQAQPQIRSSLTEAEKLLQQQGLDTNAVAGASRTATAQASGAFDQARPLINRLTNFVTTTEPAVLAEYALGGVAAYYLAPPVLGFVVGSLRGYAGDISPPAALDLVSTRRNTFIIDMRSTREKESGGALDIPGGGKLIELEYAAVEDRKLRGQLRNVPKLELLVTVEEIAALKKVGKGSTLLLLDGRGSQAKAVAKALRGKGFRSAFVVSGGFKGWSDNKLRVKPSSSVSRVEVLAPGALGAAFGGGGGTLSGSTRGSNRTLAGRRNTQKALPGGR